MKGDRLPSVPSCACFLRFAACRLTGVLTRSLWCEQDAEGYLSDWTSSCMFSLNPDAKTSSLAKKSLESGEPGQS